MERIHVKLYFYAKGVVNEIRRLNLPKDLMWPDLYQTLAGMLGTPDFNVEYQDPENDRVTLSSTVEWDECLRIASYSDVERPLRLHIRRKPRKEKPEEPRACEHRKGTPPPFLQPERVYTNGDGPLPPVAHLAEIQVTVPSVVARYLPPNWEQDPQITGIPEWLRPAMDIIHDKGQVDMDVNIDAFVACLNSQALSLMDQKKFPEALQLLKDGFVIKPTPEKLYNIACCHSLMGAVSEALQSLNEAIQHGYKNLQHMLRDPDLMPLHSADGWEDLVNKLRVYSDESKSSSSSSLQEQSDKISIPQVFSLAASTARNLSQALLSNLSRNTPPAKEQRRDAPEPQPAAPAPQPEQAPTVETTVDDLQPAPVTQVQPQPQPQAQPEPEMPPLARVESQVPPEVQVQPVSQAPVPQVVPEVTRELPPTRVAAPSVDPKQLTKYREQLSCLNAMGFDDDARNVAVLEKTKGSIPMAVERLLC